MILIDALIAGEHPTGIGVYSFHVIQNLPRNLEFVVLTHSPHLFASHIPTRKAPAALSPDHGKRAAILRLLYLQTLSGSEILYRTYHGLSLVWRGPQIITIHDILPILFPQRYPHQYYLYRFFLKPWIGKADAIVTVSQRSKSDIVEYFRYPEERVYVFYPGYDATRFRPLRDAHALQRTKARYGLRKYLMVVGAQFSHKNVEVVIQALKKIVPSYQLLITGAREPYASRLRELVRDLRLEQYVVFVPYVSHEELPYLYAGAECLVHPSRYEGFGIPVLEAMAVGTPVIGTPAIREAGGDAVIYADPDDPETWIEALKTLQQTRDMYVQKGQARVRHFSWRKTAMGIAKLLQNFSQKR